MVEESAIKGALGEVKAAVELMELGYVVSTPKVIAAKYDLIVDIHHNLIRVQVKTAYHSKWGLEVNLTNKSGPYTSIDVDAFIIYDEEKDACYFYWIHEVGSHRIRRRGGELDDHNLVKNRLANDF